MTTQPASQPDKPGAPPVVNVWYALLLEIAALKAKEASAQETKRTA